MTSIEWFIKEIEKHDKEFSSFYGAEITQAKQIEQQQREDAFKEGGEAVSDYLNKEACRQLGILPHTQIK